MKNCLMFQSKIGNLCSGPEALSHSGGRFHHCQGSQGRSSRSPCAQELTEHAGAEGHGDRSLASARLEMAELLQR